MKYLIASLVLLLSATTAVAQQQTAVQAQKPVICDRVDVVLSNINKNEYKEKAQWVGNSPDRTTFILFTNKKTGTWTLLQVIGEAACVLGFGNSFENQN